MPFQAAGAAVPPGDLAPGLQGAEEARVAIGSGVLQAVPAGRPLLDRRAPFPWLPVVGVDGSAHPTSEGAMCGEVLLAASIVAGVTSSA